jgi:hypothetical protein
VNICEIIRDMISDNRRKYMSLYKKVLSQAWKIVWRHKYLWFFGFFAALLGGGSEYNVLFRGFSGDAGQALFPGWQRIAETGIFSSQTFTNIGRIMREDPLSLMILLAVFLVILILGGFLIWLSVVSQAALVNNAAGHLANKNVDFGRGIRVGINKFWPVLGLNVIVKLLVCLVFILIAFLTVLTTSKLIYIISFIIFIPIALALSFIIKYAVAYIIIKENGFMESIKEGWRLFIGNWLVSLEMAFILFVINLLVSLALALVVLTLAIPFLFLAVAFYKMAAAAGFWFIIILGFILILAIIVFGGAILSSFQISSWTGLFVQLVNKGGTSKIIRVAEAVKKKITE